MPTHLGLGLYFSSKGRGLSLDNTCKAIGDLRRDGVRADGGVRICHGSADLREHGTRLARRGNGDQPLINGESSNYKDTSAQNIETNSDD